MGIQGAIAAVEGAAYLVSVLVLLKLYIDYDDDGPGAV